MIVYGEEMKEAWKSFVRKVTGKELLTQRAKLRYLLIAVLSVHVILLGMSLFFSVFPMVIYSLFVILFYSFIYRNVKIGRRIVLSYILTFMELTVQILMGTLMIGWGAGFAMYIFCVVAVSFYMLMSVTNIQNKLAIPPLVTVACLIFYVVLYRYSYTEPAYYDIGESGIRAFYIFNAVVTFLLLGALSDCFVLEIIGSQNLLTLKNRNLEHIAGVDPLTGLLNRRYMEEYLEEAMDQAKQKGTRFSLIMGDIDNFKKINDTYGHDCGDQALVHVAQIMKQCVRDNDAVCRWGGEEFLILIQGNMEIAAAIGERIRTMIEEQIVVYHEVPVPFTITFGVSTYVPGYRMETLIHIADERLYGGKQNGKNQVVTTTT